MDTLEFIQKISKAELPKFLRKSFYKIHLSANFRKNVGNINKFD